MQDMLNRIPFGGKFLRPKLSIATAKEMKINEEELLDGMTTVEMIHLASLLHDDVIDDADIRRGKPTINRLNGNKTAVSVGDLLMVVSFRIIKRYGVPKLNDMFVDTLVKMADAEITEYANESNFELKWKDYLRIVEGKTGALFGFSMAIPAFLAGKDTEKFYSLGERIGSIYQEMDDIVDLSETSEVSGKDAFKDVENGVISYPLLVMRDIEKDTKMVREIMKSKDPERIRELVSSSGCIEESFRRLNRSISEIKTETPWLADYMDTLSELVGKKPSNRVF